MKFNCLSLPLCVLFCSAASLLYLYTAAFMFSASVFIVILGAMAILVLTIHGEQKSFLRVNCQSSVDNLNHTVMFII